MRVLHVVAGFPPPLRGRVFNIFSHRQIKSLEKYVPEMRVIHAGYGSKLKDILLLSSKLLREKRKFHPELVHVHYASLIGAISIYCSGKTPTIVSIIGSDLYGSYADYSTQSWRSKLAQRLTRYCARHASACIVMNEEMKRVVDRWGSKRTEDIPHGVNLDVFKELDRLECREQLGLEPEGKYVLFQTRQNDPVKRRDLAERSVNLLNQRSLVKVELLLLEAASPDQVPIYLNAADVVLLCSNHEGTPNIVKEALACNRPVVSTDVGDVRQRFASVDGLFLVSQSVEDIAQKLHQALTIGKSNGRSFVEKYSEEIIAIKVFDLYVELI